jgi:hypothetical protein
MGWMLVRAHTKHTKHAVPGGPSFGCSCSVRKLQSAEGFKFFMVCSLLADKSCSTSNACKHHPSMTRVVGAREARSELKMKPHRVPSRAPGTQLFCVEGGTAFDFLVKSTDDLKTLISDTFRAPFCLVFDGSNTW